MKNDQLKNQKQRPKPKLGNYFDNGINALIHYLLVTILVATLERVERAWFLAFIEYRSFQVFIDSTLLFSIFQPIFCVSKFKS